jgi:hypothetical protein
VDATVTALTAGITSTALFGTLTSVAPLIITGVLVGFAYTVTKRVVKSVSKGKAGL